MTTRKKRCIDEEIILEMIDDPNRGWIVIPPSGKGIPASIFEVCLWKEILRLRTRVSYLKARLDNYEQN